MNRSHRSACLTLLFAAGVGSASAQQSTEPEFTAPPGSAQVVTTPVYSAPLPVDSGRAARDAVDVFKQTCLVAVGNAQGLVDAAINAGMAPYLGGPSGDADASSLLGDTPGQVFSAAAGGDVLLAIGDNGLCTVWANRADGPKLKAAFVAAMDALRDRGSSVRAVRERTIQRAGGWRQQLGYDVSDVRANGGASGSGPNPGGFAADAVTLLTPQPGVQVLRAAPLGASASAAAAPASR